MYLCIHWDMLTVCTAKLSSAHGDRWDLMTFRERVDIKYLALTAPVVTPLTCTPLLCSWYTDCSVSERYLTPGSSNSTQNKNSEEKNKISSNSERFPRIRGFKCQTVSKIKQNVFGYI